MLKGADNAERAWNFLKDHDFTNYGAAGLIGNLHAESAINPINLQNSGNNRLNITDQQYTDEVDDGVRNFEDNIGYGIAQWTFFSRKRALLEYAVKYKKSIGDLEMQLNFLLKELKQYGLLDKVKNSFSVEDASTIILLQFEKPADKSMKNIERRAGFGQMYYNRFADPLLSDLEVLKILGIVNTPEYWQNTAPYVKYLPNFIHNMAEYVKK